MVMERNYMKNYTSASYFAYKPVSTEKLSNSYLSHLKDLCFDLLILIKKKNFPEIQNIAQEIKKGFLPEDMEEFRYFFNELESAAADKNLRDTIFFYEEISLLAHGKQFSTRLN